MGEKEEWRLAAGIKQLYLPNEPPHFSAWATKGGADTLRIFLNAQKKGDGGKLK